MSVRLSVITVTHNRVGLLKQKLAALEQQTLPPEQFEVVVLVNSCTDETVKLLGALKTSYRLQIQVSPELLSPAPARNLCAAAAKGRILYFSDDDCLPAPETLQKHLAEQTRPCVAVGGLEFISADHSERWQPRQARFWNLNGANTSVPAAAFRCVGGFDTSLSGYGGEDVALGYALKELPFVALPNATAQHLGPNPVRSGDLNKAYSAGRNAQHLARRYPALAYRLGVHWALLALKRFALLGPLRLVWKRFAPDVYIYERAYLLGALEEREHA